MMVNLMEMDIELNDLMVVWLLEELTIKSIVKGFDELFSTLDIFQGIFGTIAL